MRFFGYRLRKSFRYMGLFAASLAIFVTASSFTISGDQTLKGMASIFEALSVESDKYFDLEIEDYEFKKISDPSSSNIDSVYALRTTVVNNNEEGFENEQVVLSVEPINKHLVLSQEDGAFALNPGTKHVTVQNVSIPFYVAEQDLTVKLTPLSFHDSDAKNNEVSVQIEQNYTGLANFKIESINESGQVDFSWALPASHLQGLEYSILSHKSEEAIQEDVNFKTVPDSYYGYGLGDFSQMLLDKFDFEENDFSVEDKFFKLDEDPFFTENFHVLMLKAVNPETSAVLYSDPIYLSPQNLLNKGMLAKKLVTLLDLPMAESALVLYEDVDENHEYYEYIRAIYAAGYADNERYFSPQAMLTRRMVAKAMVLAFDIPLVGNQQFIDVLENDADFYAINAMKSLVPGLKTQHKFLPDEPATADWLENLIETLAQNYEIS